MMRRNLINLQRPLSLRDIRLVIANFQCCWLDLLTMLAYYQDYWDCVHNLQPGVGPWDVNTDLMGVFTNKDSVTLTLWEVGMLVWHISIDVLPSDLRIGKRVTMTWDLDIETNLDDVQLLSPIHTGFDGEAWTYLCWPIGNLAIGNYIPLLWSEMWDDWIKHAGSPNANSAIVAEMFLPSVPSTSSAILASPSLPLPLPLPLPAPSVTHVVEHALSPIMFSSCRQSNLKTILLGLVDEISACVMSAVGKTLSPLVTARNVQGHERCNQHEWLSSIWAC